MRVIGGMRQIELLPLVGQVFRQDILHAPRTYSQWYLMDFSISLDQSDQEDRKTVQNRLA